MLRRLEDAIVELDERPNVAFLVLFRYAIFTGIRSEARCSTCGVEAPNAYNLRVYADHIVLGRLRRGARR